MNTTDKTQHLNDLLDVVYNDNIDRLENKGLYYKAGCMSYAAKSVEMYEFLLNAQDVLDIPFIKKIKFNLEEEYNDEGGTYVQISTDITYQNGEEVVTTTFYSGCSYINESDDEDFVQLASEHGCEEMLNEFLGDVYNLDGETVQDDIIFQKEWTRDNIWGLYRTSHSQAFSAIERHLLSLEVKDKPAVDRIMKI